jgi:hypothetical protein
LAEGAFPSSSFRIYGQQKKDEEEEEQGCQYKVFSTSFYSAVFLGCGSRKE